MASSIEITGFTQSTKTPGAVGEAKFAQGTQNPDAAAKKLLLLGNKTSAGSLTADGAPVQCFTDEEVIAAAGARSELAQMGYMALRYGIAPYLGAVTEAGGGAAGTWTLTFANGNASSAGTVYFNIAHAKFGVVKIPINIASGNTPTQSAVAAKTAINTACLGRLPYTADNSSGVLTITSANLGVRANQHIAHLDITEMAGTQTAALTGGTALSDGGIPMTGGSGQDTLTAMLSTVLPDEYQYNAIAANDSTSVDAFLDQIDAKNHPLVGMTEFLVVGLNGTQAAAITFASTSMNHPLGELVFLKSCRTHPSVIAASMAALRATTEGATPNKRYNKIELLGVAPHKSSADVPGRSATDAMLDAGVTPITTRNSKAVIVRAITTYCLNGSAPDYRCLDVANSVVAQKVRRDVVSYWDNEYSVENEYVGPDDPEGLPPEEGTATPAFWNAEVYRMLKVFERKPFNMLTAVDANPPYSEWDDDAKRIMTRIKSITKFQNHQQGVLVEQTTI